MFMPVPASLAAGHRYNQGSVKQEWVICIQSLDTVFQSRAFSCLQCRQDIAHIPALSDKFLIADSGKVLVT
jgi:hypothetical protein